MITFNFDGFNFKTIKNRKKFDLRIVVDLKYI